MNRIKIAAGAVLAAMILATLGTGVHAYVTGAKWSTSSVVFLINPRNADVTEAAAEIHSTQGWRAPGAAGT